MQNMQNMRLGSWQFWLMIIEIKLNRIRLYREIGYLVRSQIEWFFVSKRIKKYTLEKQHEICDRFFRIAEIKDLLEVKQILKSRSEFLVRLSEETGRPQWELREELKRKYTLYV